MTVTVMTRTTSCKRRNASSHTFILMPKKPQPTSGAIIDYPSSAEHLDRQPFRVDEHHLVVGGPKVGPGARRLELSLDALRLHIVVVERVDGVFAIDLNAEVRQPCRVTVKARADV